MASVFLSLAKAGILLAGMAVHLVFAPTTTVADGFKEGFVEEKYGHTVNRVSSGILEENFYLPPFNRRKPFWTQIGNPYRIPDIESFYNRSNGIILNEFKEHYLHSRLAEIRSPFFLQTWLQEKFDRWAKIGRTNEGFEFYRPNSFDRAFSEEMFYRNHPQPVKELLQAFEEALENKDLDSIKDWVLKNRFSPFEKFLITVLLINTGDFNNHIFDFIRDIGLDINQGFVAGDFAPINTFYGLYPSSFVNSLAYEILATINPDMIQALLSAGLFPSERQNPLRENPLHFFVRAAAERKAEIKPGQLEQASRIMIENFHHLMEEKDLIGFNPLMIAARWGLESFISQSFEFMSSQGPRAQQILIGAFSQKGPWGRDSVDIALDSRHFRLAAHIIEWRSRLSVTSGAGRYAGEAPRGSLNKLPYIRTSPVLLSILDMLQAHLSAYFKELSEKGTAIPVIPDQKPFIIFGRLGHITDLIEAGILDIWERERHTVVTELMNDPVFFSIFSAIQKRTPQAIDSLDAKAKDLLNQVFYFDKEPGAFEKNPDGRQKMTLRREDHSSQVLWSAPAGLNGITILTHFLNEAVIHSSLPAVRYLLENHFDRLWFENFVEGRPQGRVFAMDPLSLSLFVYSSLSSSEEGLKSSARQIIRLLADYQDPSKLPNAKTASTPMGWALSLGLLDEVRFFHEEKNAPVPESVGIHFKDIHPQTLQIETVMIVDGNNFENLREYIMKVQPELGQKGACRRIFAQ